MVEGSWNVTNWLKVTLYTILVNLNCTLKVWKKKFSCKDLESFQYLSNELLFIFVF